MLGLLSPVREAADKTPGFLLLVATVGGAIVAIWSLIVRFRKSAFSQWVMRRFVRPIHKALIVTWREEKEARKRAAADIRIQAAITAVVDPRIAPLEKKIDEIAHSTNGKAAGAPTMSAEISALTETVGEIAKAMAQHRLKVEEIIVDEWTPRMTAIEASQTVIASLVAEHGRRLDQLENAARSWGRRADDPPPQLASQDTS